MDPKQGLTSSSPDYDMTGYISKYGVPDQSKGQHLTDEFKLPNHPTFSTNSKYSTPEQPGGEWKQENNTWHFYASPHNLQNTPPEQLRQYFDKVEPNSILHMGQEVYTPNTVPAKQGLN
jgi:hypothetical protein